MIDRRNILELIGKHGSRYRSCMLTCYALDFTFFEERVLPVLRTANIRNVNILADGHYLELAQEVTTGKEFMHNKTYNFLPVYEAGVFHPKIMLLTGEKEGLLFIGSGNITAAGMSTNDEIWGAFQLHDHNHENAPIFRAVWDYLQMYLNSTPGFIRQKIDWIRQYSPWISALPVPQDWIRLDTLGLQLRFIGNTAFASTFRQLISSTIGQPIQDMTLVSPYFDASGELLHQLVSHFNPLHVRCMVDPDSGMLPVSLRAEISDRIQFYNWADCKKDKDKSIGRLHAKMVHLCSTEEEYLLLGSANMSMAAFGSIDGRAANGEAGILLKRKRSRKDWIAELGIKFPDSTIDIRDKKFLGRGKETIPAVLHKYKVLYAELVAHEITLYLDKEAEETLRITVKDRLDNNVENVVSHVEKGRVILRISDADKCFKLFLADNGGTRISNYCLIHRLEALIRCNPDQRQEKLDLLLEEGFENGEGITDLIQYIDYSWADEQSAPDHVANGVGTSSAFENDQKHPSKDYQSLKAEEFNQVSAASLQKQSGSSFGPNEKIADFLSLYISNAFEKESLYEESEEQKLFEDKEQKGEGREAGHKSTKRIYGQREKAIVHKYFKKLDSLYTKSLKGLFETKIWTFSPKEPITISALSSILVALHLIQIKQGRKFKVNMDSVDGTAESMTREELYILNGNFGDSAITIKGFILNVVGKFLLLASPGYKEYEYDIQRQKLELKKLQLAVKGSCLILNLHWNESEKLYKDTLLLNCLHYTLGEQLLNEKLFSDFIIKMEEFSRQGYYVYHGFESQLDVFKANLLPRYLVWLKKFKHDLERKASLIKPTASLKKGQILFKRELGFSMVGKLTSSKKSNNVSLYRAGFPFEDGQYSLLEAQLGEKCIVFE